MGCLIGLDFGIKYSGISTTDPNQIIASPLDTCQTNELIPFLKDQCNGDLEIATWSARLTIKSYLQKQ